MTNSAAQFTARIAQNDIKITPISLENFLSSFDITGVCSRLDPSTATPQ